MRIFEEPDADDGVPDGVPAVDGSTAVDDSTIIMFLFHLVGRPAGFQLYRVTSSGPDPMMKTLMSDSHTSFVGCQNQHIAKRLDLP